MIDGVHHVVLGCSNFEASYKLFSEDLGLSLVTASTAVTNDRKRLWGLAQDSTCREAVFGTPGRDRGLVRLVDFGLLAGTPVREGAEPFECSPKNLDYLTPDAQEGYARLVDRGHRFRSEPVSWTYEGVLVCEAQLPLQDGYNIVITSPMPEDKVEVPYSGFSSSVFVVPDIEAAVLIYNQGLGLPLRHSARFAGPEIEKMVGLPPGAGLNMRVVGPQERLGQVELVQYDGVVGRNLTSAARPPRTGLLYPAFHTEDIAKTERTLVEAGFWIETGQTETHDSLYGTALVLTAVTPWGQLMEFWTAA